MATKKVLNLEVDSNIGQVSKDAKEAASEFQFMGVSLNSVKSAFSKIIPTAKAMFGTIKAGIISTGVGALVVAVGSLVTWFTKTKKGAETLLVVFKGVGAAVNVIVDRISKFGGGIAKILSGNVKAGLTDMKNSFKGIGDEIRSDTTAAMNLQMAFNNLRDRQRDLNVETAQARADIEAYKLIAEDVTKTEEERLSAAQKAFKIENNLLDKRISNAEDSLKLQREEMELSENMAEDLDAEAQLQIDLANIKQESVTKQIELNNKINAIEAETRAKRKERHDTRMQELADQRAAEFNIAEETSRIEEELATARLKTEEDRQLEAIIKKRDIALEAAEQEIKDLEDLERRKTAINELFQEEYFAFLEKTSLVEIEGNERTAEQIIAGEKHKAQAVHQIRMADANNLSSAVGLMKMFAGENEGLMAGAIVAENVAGIAKTVIQTQASNAATIAQGAALAIPTGGASVATAAALVTKTNIAAGISIAASIAATAQALGQLGKGGGGGSGGASLPSASSGGGGGGTPAPEFATGTFELSGGQEIEPMRAYVVSDEITQSQNALEIIRRRATI
jgi:hypothetical protein